MTTHPRILAYGISAGVILSVGLVLSSVVAPHDAMAFWGFRHRFGGGF